MQFIYKIPGYILCLMGGFFLSWGGLLIRNFEGADVWQILFWRAFFFSLTLIIFLFLNYRKDTFIIFITSSHFLVNNFGNHGLWIALLLFMVMRSIGLNYYFNRILKKF